MLANLQALRALAAIAVVVFHVGLMPPTDMPFTLGAAGVDLFFVLSGFIIAYSSSRDPRRFLRRRLVRIVPPYWIATIVAALFTLEQMSWRDAAGWMVQSLFFLPDPTGRPALIFVAWTLVYELAFYILYWLALRTAGRWAPLAASSAVLLIGFLPMPGLPGPWPLFLEFAIGIGIFSITDRLGFARRIDRRAGLLLVVTGLVLLPLSSRLTGYSPADHQSLGRVLAWGLPAGCLVLGAIMAERSGYAVRIRMILSLGAASYAIYLLHPIAVGQLLSLPSNAPPASWIACLAATTTIVLLSVAFRFSVEAPLLRKSRRLLGDDAPVEQRLSGANDV